jgi:alpha-tubulin suppressor-like RCC1 family protein
VAAAVFGASVGQLAVTGDAVAPGAATTCARLQDGTVWCVGSNLHGALGAGSAAALSLLALPVSGLGDAVDLSAGLNHLCAVSAGGEVRCWGAGALGQLGTGAQGDADAPVVVQGLPAAAQRVWCGGDACCATVAGGGLWCWGTQQGTLAALLPREAVPLPGAVSAMVLTSAQRCLLTSGGLVACAGANAHGSLGDGTTVSRSAFGPVSGLEAGVRSIGAYAQHPFDATFCAVKDDGTVWCWGLSSGIISDPALLPEQITPLGGTAQALVGGIVLKADGRWYVGPGWRPLFGCR